MVRTDSEVLAALRKKLAKPGNTPVTLQAIHQRRAKLQTLVPMPTDIATYVVAQRAGVTLHAYLDAATLDQVATAEQRLSAKEASAQEGTAARARETRKPATRAAIVNELHLDKIKVPNAALSAARQTEAEKMAKVYPTLYAFENSVREFVDGHLTAKLGKDWDNDPKVVSVSIRNTVERNKMAEGQHRYHSRRNARPLYYTNIGDLAAITASENAWPVFKPLFPSDKWLAALIEKIETSRNVVAHMNPLQKRDIDRIRINFEDWLEQIKGHEPPIVP
jgi:hypothetical protein